MTNEDTEFIVCISSVILIFIIYYFILFLFKAEIKKFKEKLISLEPDFFQFDTKGQYAIDLEIRIKRIKNDKEFQENLTNFFETYMWHSKITLKPIPLDILILIGSYSSDQKIRSNIFDLTFKEKIEELEMEVKESDKSMK